jgi:hypothetical protein
MVQEHNYNLACANTDVVYGIGLYRISLDRTLQLGQSFKQLLSGRAVLLYALWDAVISINKCLYSGYKNSINKNSKCAPPFNSGLQRDIQHQKHLGLYGGHKTHTNKSMGKAKWKDDKVHVRYPGGSCELTKKDHLRLQKQAKKAQEDGRIPSHFINRLPPVEAKALEVVWLRMLAGVYAKEK